MRHRVLGFLPMPEMWRSYNRAAAELGRNFDEFTIKRTVAAANLEVLGPRAAECKA